MIHEDWCSTKFEAAAACSCVFPPSLLETVIHPLPPEGYPRHAPHCASRSMLLSTPPQFQDCNCGVQAYVDFLKSQPKAEPSPPASASEPVGAEAKAEAVASNVVSLRRIPGGPASPASTEEGFEPSAPAGVVAALRQLARQLEAGDRGEIPRQLIIIPVMGDYTDVPYVLTPEPMKHAELIGRLEIAKAAALDDMWVSDDH